VDHCSDTVFKRVTKKYK
jgi:hypothetical protein